MHESVKLERIHPTYGYAIPASKMELIWIYSTEHEKKIKVTEVAEIVP